MPHATSTPSADHFIVGVDLGGTNIVVGATSADGSRQFGMHTTPTRADLGGDAVVARIAELIERVISETTAQLGTPRTH